MKGFTDRALFLFPRYGTYNSMTDEAKRLFKHSVKNMITYLKGKGIESYIFNTDDLVDFLGSDIGLKVYDVITQEDRFLLESFFLGGAKAKTGEKIDDKILNAARKKYPVARGTSKEEKLEVFNNRDKFITTRVIAEQDLIINFEPSTKAHYKVSSKEGDGRIVVQVSKLNYSIEAKLSGEPVDVISLFEYNRANMPLYKWEV